MTNVQGDHRSSRQESQLDYNSQTPKYHGRKAHGLPRLVHGPTWLNQREAGYTEEIESLSANIKTKRYLKPFLSRRKLPDSRLASPLPQSLAMQALPLHQSPGEIASAIPPTTPPQMEHAPTTRSGRCYLPIQI